MVRSSWLSILAGAVVASASACAAETGSLRLKVTAGEHERVDARVSFLLPAQPRLLLPILSETTGGMNERVPAQIDTDGRLWWIASGKTAAGAVRQYRLNSDGAIGDPSHFIEARQTDSAVEVSYEGKKLLRYNTAQVEPPEGVNPRFGRSAHIHPVWTADGAIVTDELPPDHYHQSGIFLAYTKTQFENRDVDFWNLGGGKGRVRFKELKGASSGRVFARVVAVHEHVDLTAESKGELGKTTGGKVALVETWDMRVWTSGWESGYWLLEIESVAAAAGESPLFLPKYHYGGMALRGARNWTPQNVSIVTADGDDRLKGNHTRERWCNMQGKADGTPGGIAIMTHPSNFRFPEPLRIHEKMPYMVYTPSFVDDWSIQPGRPNASRYQFVIHRGDLSKETLDRIWRDFAQPIVAVAED
jgi:hypothetical protein